MIIGIGNPVYDFIKTPHISTETRVLSGCSTNACLAVRKLGLAAGLVGRVGPDYEVQFKQDMDRFGIDYVLYPTAETGGFGLIYDESGDRTLDVLGIADPLDTFPALLGDAEYLLVGPILGEVPPPLLREIAARFDVPLVLDPQGLMRRIRNGRIDRYRNPDLIEILPLFDVVKPNEHEAQILTGINPRQEPQAAVEALYELMTAGPRRPGHPAIAIITLAEAGSLIFDGQEHIRIPAYRTLGQGPHRSRRHLCWWFHVSAPEDAAGLAAGGMFRIVRGLSDGRAHWTGLSADFWQKRNGGPVFCLSSSKAHSKRNDGMLARFRTTYQRLIMPLGRLSVRLGLGPDFWTYFSLVMSLVAALMLARWWWGLGLVLAISANLADAMDGATARAGGTSSTFGTVLDHCVDRYVEFILLGGVLVSGHVPAWLVYAATFGMVMASYVRAKAESAGGLESCTVGLAGRAEKLILFFVGLGLEGWFHVNGAIFWAIALIAVISHVTFVQRLVYTRQQLNPSGSRSRKDSHPHLAEG